MVDFWWRRGATSIGRRTCNRVSRGSWGSTVGRALLRNNLGKVVHIHVLLSPNSTD